MDDFLYKWIYVILIIVSIIAIISTCASVYCGKQLYELQEQNYELKWKVDNLEKKLEKHYDYYHQ